MHVKTALDVNIKRAKLFPNSPTEWMNGMLVYPSTGGSSSLPSDEPNEWHSFELQNYYSSICHFPFDYCCRMCVLGKPTDAATSHGADNPSENHQPTTMSHDNFTLQCYSGVGGKAIEEEPWEGVWLWIVDEFMYLTMDACRFDASVPGPGKIQARQKSNE